MARTRRMTPSLVIYSGYRNYIQLSVLWIEDFLELKVTRPHVGYGKEYQKMPITLEFLEASAT